MFISLFIAVITGKFVSIWVEILQNITGDNDVTNIGLPLAWSVCVFLYLLTMWWGYLRRERADVPIRLWELVLMLIAPVLMTFSLALLFPDDDVLRDFESAARHFDENYATFLKCCLAVFFLSIARHRLDDRSTGRAETFGVAGFAKFWRENRRANALRLLAIVIFVIAIQYSDEVILRYGLVAVSFVLILVYIFFEADRGAVDSPEEASR